MAALGFIGLGAMGTPMAEHLLQAGHSLAVFARRRDALDPIVARGGVAKVSQAAVAADSEIVFTMVTDTAAVESVLLGNEGVIHGARAGLVVVDHSTIDPSATRRISATLK